MSEPRPSENIAESQNMKSSSPVKGSPPSVGGESWSIQKTKARPDVRRQETPPGEGITVGEEKTRSKKKDLSMVEKRFSKGYLKVKIRMLEANQLLAWFVELKKEAVSQTFERTGEVDNSYLQAKIEINIVKSRLEETGHYGYANCHITDDLDNKMYYIMLGKNPDGTDYNREFSTNEDGTPLVTIDVYLDFPKMPMVASQVKDWLKNQRREFEFGKIEKKDYDKWEESYRVYDLFQEWEKKREKIDELKDSELTDLIGRIGKKIISYKTALDPEAKTEIRNEIIDTFENVTKNYVDNRNTESSEILINTINDEMAPLEELAEYISLAEITAEPMFVTNNEDGSSHSHFYIMDVPPLVTKEKLRQYFSSYNTKEGDFTHNYGTTEKPRVEDGPFPHIWIVKDKRTGRTDAHIAYYNANCNDGPYAFEMRRKFRYESELPDGKIHVAEFVLFWWDDSRRKGPKSLYNQRGGRIDTGEYREVRRYQDSNRRGTFERDRNRTMPKPTDTALDVNDKGGEGRPTISTINLYDILNGKASGEGIKSQWATPMNRILLVEDESGIVIDAPIYDKAIGSSGPPKKRGYDPTLRDDGNLSQFF